MKNKAVPPIVVSALILSAGSSWAHHSMPMFDYETTVVYESVVKEFQYTNPHSWLVVDVTNEDGTVTTWGFETSSPSSLRLKGIRASESPPGMKITVTGNPMQDGRHAAMLLKTVTQDGREFKLR